MLSRQVGRNIRWRRKKARLSLEELAYRASLDTSHIGKIERGCWNPSLQTLARIATALGISPRALFNCGTLDEPDYARLIAFACSTIPYYEFLSVYDPLFLGEFLGSFLMERITVAGNFYELLKNIRAFASDLRFPYGPMGSASADAGEMTISGKA